MDSVCLVVGSDRLSASYGPAKTTRRRECRFKQKEGRSAMNGLKFRIGYMQTLVEMLSHSLPDHSIETLC